MDSNPLPCYSGGVDHRSLHGCDGGFILGIHEREMKMKLDKALRTIAASIAEAMDCGIMLIDVGNFEDDSKEDRANWIMSSDDGWKALSNWLKHTQGEGGEIQPRFTKPEMDSISDVLKRFLEGRGWVCVLFDEDGRCCGYLANVERNDVVRLVAELLMKRDIGDTSDQIDDETL